MIWAGVPEVSRLSYGTIPAPGQLIAQALDYTNGPDPGSFAVLRLSVQTIDALHLGPNHNRARFSRMGNWAGGMAGALTVARRGLLYGKAVEGIKPRRGAAMPSLRHRLLKYPPWSSHRFGPFSAVPEQGVCDCDDASHDGGHGEFSGGPEGIVCGFEGWIEADCDEGWPVDSLSQDGASALNEGLAAPLAGLPCHWGEACEADRFVEEGHGHREAARFVNDMVILKRATRGLAPKVQGNHAAGKLAPYSGWLRERLAAKGDLTLDGIVAELAAVHGVTAHRGSVGLWLHRLGLSHKKLCSPAQSCGPRWPTGAGSGLRPASLTWPTCWKDLCSSTNRRSAKRNFAQHQPRKDDRLGPVGKRLIDHAPFGHGHSRPSLRALLMTG